MFAQQRKTRQGKDLFPGLLRDPKILSRRITPLRTAYRYAEHRGHPQKPEHATNMSDANDKQADLALMQRIAAGEESAVVALYDRFGSLVYRLAYQAMPTRDEAEDAVQEVFVRLWKTAERYDPSRAALVTWVLLITRRHLVDRLRRSQSRIKPVKLNEEFRPPIAEPVDSESLEREERFASLMEKIATLPELQRTVVMRAYLGGQTLRQIGEELDTPIGTVKSALSRALVRLRECSGVEESVS